MKGVEKSLNSLKNHKDMKPIHLIHLNEAMKSLKKIKFERSNKILIVLDINGIFTNRLWIDPSTTKSFENGTLDVEFKMFRNSATWFRRDYKEFFRILFGNNNYEIAFWSSMKMYSIDDILSHMLTQEQLDCLLFIWDQEKCERLEEDDVLLKLLNDVWYNFPQYDQYNTIIIDDSSTKMQDNPSLCCITPDTWDRKRIEQKSLKHLMKDLINKINIYFK